MWGLPPALDMDYEKRVQAAIREVIAQGLAESAHDVSDGGLAVALAECCAEGIGAAISLDTGLRPEFALFHEGPSRILVSTSAARGSGKNRARKQGRSVRLGVTMKERLRISNGSVKSEAWIDCPVDRLREVWENALENLLSPIPVG